MALYYEQQLDIARGNQARKDREFAEEMKSRKLYPSEQKVVDEAMDDLLQMQLDEIRKTNKNLDESIAESKSRLAKYDNLPSSRRTSLGKSLIDKHYEQALANKYGRNGRKEGRPDTGRYTSSSFGYEVKAFDEKTTTQRERKSLGVSEGFREWDHRTFAANVERKLGVR